MYDEDEPTPELDLSDLDEALRWANDHDPLDTLALAEDRYASYGWDRD